MRYTFYGFRFLNTLLCYANYYYRLHPPTAYQIYEMNSSKLKNMLKAEQDGTVKSVNVSVGDAVEKNNVLIDFE